MISIVDNATFLSIKYSKWVIHGFTGHVLNLKHNLVEAKYYGNSIFKYVVMYTFNGFHHRLLP